MGTASALTPGGQTAAVVFAGIGIASTAVSIAFYSNDPFWQGMREIVKMAIPIKNPLADKAKDEAIDKIYNIMQNHNNIKQCP